MHVRSRPDIQSTFGSMTECESPNAMWSMIAGVLEARQSIRAYMTEECDG